MPVVKTVINSYQINQMDEDDQMAIIPSSDDYGRDCGLENNQSVLKSCISQIGKAERVSILDAHNVSFALHTALLWLDAGLVEKCRKNSVKRIVMYTDDIDDLWDSDYMEKFIERANAQNVSIYVIDTGRGFCKEKLQQLTNATGGEYCSLMDTGAIIDLFLPSATEDDLYKDSDSDGISDYYEKEINEGNLCLGTGVGLGKLDYQNEDSDNDGLLDGEEMEISQGNDSFYIKVKSNPTKQDSDDDGLFDNAALYTGRKKIAPKDPQPLQPNGLKEVWKAQWMEELQGIPDELVDFEWLGNDWLKTNTTLWEKFTAAAGNAALTFRKDNHDIAYHSQQKTWQHGWGYNLIYDLAFEVGTGHNIRSEQYEFECGEEYVVWMWLGDYLNLGSGAEVGIYGTPIYVPKTSAKHWRSIDFRLPMTLNLYNYYGPEDIENVFCWAPKDDQWWITGFNNNFMNPVAEDMISVGTIDFSQKSDLFDALKSNVEGLKDNEDLKKYLIFDVEEPIVWFQWGDQIIKEK